MPHQPSPGLYDYLESSSLDPLATSIGDEQVEAQKFSHSSPIRLPRFSPTKVMRTVEDISFSSPQRASRSESKEPHSLPRRVSYQNLSPWRIRVTVEAEPEEMGIPSGRTRTATMKVPLREESPSTEMAKDRGQRSQTGSSGMKRRNTPPRGARSTSRSRRQSVTDLGITVLGDEEDLNEWSPKKSKKKGRPRSKKGKEQQEQHAAPESNVNISADDGPDVDQGRNVSEQPGFEIRPDSDVEDHAFCGGEVEKDSPELRKIDLNRVSVRSRSRPPKGHKDQHLKEDDSVLPPGTELPPLMNETETVILGSTANGYPTPTSSIQGGSDDVPDVASDPTEHHECFDTILESEGFTMIDLESIPSASHFVSPPNEGHHEVAGEVETPANKSKNDTSQSTPTSISLPPISSPAGQSQIEWRPTAIPSYLSLPEGESDLSSTVPSSPPVLARAVPARPLDSVRTRARLTPEPYSSPRLPSPPRASAAPFRPHIAQPQKSTPPKLIRVVKAGIALQGVLSPKVDSEKAHAKSPGLAQGTIKERLDGLFEGFDSGTRRELRAGLRFGEELAKRQNSCSPAEIEKKATKVSSERKVWRRETTVQYTPTTLTATSNDMVPKRACPTLTAASVESKRVKGGENVAHAALTTPVQPKTKIPESACLGTRDKEREWQVEREAVSRQIQNANASQVIVIDSDGMVENIDRSDAGEVLSQSIEEDGGDGSDIDETEGDIWLVEAEARNSSQHQTNGSSLDVSPASEQEPKSEGSGGVVNKPRRSLIPSPWKRGEDIDGASTFTTNGDVSGLLWKQPRSVARFGAGAIKRQLQGSSDAFGSGDSKQDTPLRLRQNREDIKPLSPLIDLTSISASGNSAEAVNSCKGATASEKEVPEEGESSGAEYETNDIVDESVRENGKQRQDSTEASRSDDEDFSAQDASSLPSRSMKIPVNFNDSTLSAPPLTPSFQSSTPQSSRPSTPRSALKGSRNSLGLKDNSGRKVVFSSQSFCVDDEGQESNTRIQSLSPTPPPSTIPGVKEFLQPALPPPTLSRAISGPEPEPEPEPAKNSWFGWLWSSRGTQLPSPAQPASTTSIPARAIACVDGAEAKASSGWQKTKSNLSSSRRHGSKVLPSFLRPPSYPSDPSRNVSVPLATSGEFTNVHFRTLHIIYRKSLRRSFHAPDAIRPKLQKMVGEKFNCDENEYGYFAWEVDRDAVTVLERFMMEVEWGWEGKGSVSWEWTEKELCHRLFRIIVGEEVRREQAWRQEQHREQEKKKAVTGEA